MPFSVNSFKNLHHVISSVVKAGAHTPELSVTYIIIKQIKKVKVLMFPNDMCPPGVGGASAFPPETPLAMCYVPVQQIYSVYGPDIALIQGTIFPELDKPWYGSRFHDGRSSHR